LGLAVFGQAGNGGEAPHRRHTAGVLRSCVFKLFDPTTDQLLKAAVVFDHGQTQQAHAPVVGLILQLRGELCDGSSVGLTALAPSPFTLCLIVAFPTSAHAGVSRPGASAVLSEGLHFKAGVAEFGGGHLVRTP
jgi:hypothetical protein